MPSHLGNPLHRGFLPMNRLLRFDARLPREDNSGFTGFRLVAMVADDGSGVDGGSR